MISKIISDSRSASWEMRATGIQTQNSRPEYRALLIFRSASALDTHLCFLIPISIVTGFLVMRKDFRGLRYEIYSEYNKGMD